MTGPTGIGPASAFQRRIWLDDQFQPGTALYNVPNAWRLTERLDHAALRRAAARLVARHEILRTAFVDHDGVAWQHVNPAWQPEVDRVDLRDLPPGEQASTLTGVLRTLALRPFRPESGQLLRLALIDVDTDLDGEPAAQVLFVCAHHLIWDGSSAELFLADLGASYAAETGTGPAPAAEPAQYRDFVAAEPTGAELAEGLEFLAGQLRGAPSALPLATPAAPEPHGSVTVALPAGLLPALRSTARSVGGSWFVAAATVVAALLHRWTGVDDVTFGVPMAVRGEFGEVLGPCLNTMVLRSRADPTTTGRDLLSRTRETVLDALDHQAIPFDALVAAVNPVRTPDRIPYADVCLVINDFADPPALAGHRLDPLPLDHTGAEYAVRFGLSIVCTRTGDDLAVELHYRGDRFTAAEIGAVADWLGRLLADLDAHLDRAIADLAPVTTQPRSASVPTAESRPTGPTLDLGLALPDAERVVTAAWCDVLEVARVGPQDNFFDIGGTSLRLATLRRRLETELHAELPVRLFFQHPTVRSLAAALSGGRAAAAESDQQQRAARAKAARRARRAGTHER